MLKLRGFNQTIHLHPNTNFNTSNLNLQIVKPVNFSPTTSMADSEIRSEITQTLQTEKKAENKEIPPKKKELPEPPEKPEAGDCCGSGCVRCVWDVYYDELETYNQLLKEYNDSLK
ncbi:unnamed protein product [Amaranthus hypochondriacus]